MILLLNIHVKVTSEDDWPDDQADKYVEALGEAADPLVEDLMEAMRNVPVPEGLTVEVFD